MTLMASARAQCLLIDGLKVLMVYQVHDARSYWCLSGGGVHDDETPLQAAARELKEECGLDALELQRVSTIHYAEGSIEPLSSPMTVFELPLICIFCHVAFPR